MDIGKSFQGAVQMGAAMVKGGVEAGADLIDAARDTLAGAKESAPEQTETSPVGQESAPQKADGTGAGGVPEVPKELGLSKEMIATLSSDQIKKLVNQILADGTVDGSDKKALTQLNNLLKYAAQKNDQKIDANEDSLIDALDSRGMFGTNEDIVKSNLEAIQRVHNSSTNDVRFDDVEIITQDGVGGLFGGEQKRVLKEKEPRSRLPVSVVDAKPIQLQPIDLDDVVADLPVVSLPETEEPDSSQTVEAGTSPASESPPLTQGPSEAEIAKNEQISDAGRAEHAEGVNQKRAASEAKFVSDIKKIQASINNDVPSSTIIKEMQDIVQNSDEEGVKLSYVLNMADKLGMDKSELVKQGLITEQHLKNPRLSLTPENQNKLNDYFKSYPFGESHVEKYKQHINDVVASSIEGDKIVSGQYDELRETFYGTNYIYESRHQVSEADYDFYQQFKTSVNTYEMHNELAESTQKLSRVSTDNMAKANESLSKYYDKRSEDSVLKLSTTVLNMTEKMTASEQTHALLGFPNTEAILDDLKAILETDANGNIKKNAEGQPTGVKKPISEATMDKLNALWNSLEQVGMDTGLDKEPGEMAEIYFDKIGRENPELLDKVLQNPTAQLLRDKPELMDHADLLQQLENPKNTALKNAIYAGDTAEVERLMGNHTKAMFSGINLPFGMQGPDLPPEMVANIGEQDLLDLGKHSFRDLNNLTQLLAGDSEEKAALRALVKAEGKNIASLIQDPEGGFDELNTQLSLKDEFNEAFWEDFSQLDKAKNAVMSALKKRGRIASDLSVALSHLKTAASDPALEAPQQQALREQISMLESAIETVEAGGALPEPPVSHELDKIMRVVKGGEDIQTALKGLSNASVFRQQLMEKMTPENVESILKHLEPAQRAQVETILSNPELMDAALEGALQHNTATGDPLKMQQTFSSLLNQALQMGEAGDGEGIRALFTTPVEGAPEGMTPMDLVEDMSVVVSEMKKYDTTDKAQLQALGAGLMEVSQRARKQSTNVSEAISEYSTSVADRVTQRSNDRYVRDFLEGPDSASALTPGQTDSYKVAEVFSRNNVSLLPGETVVQAIARLAQSEDPEDRSSFLKIYDDIGKIGTDYSRELHGKMAVLESSLAGGLNRRTTTEAVVSIQTAEEDLCDEYGPRLQRLNINEADIRSLIHAPREDDKSLTDIITERYPALGLPENSDLLTDLLSLRSETETVVENSEFHGRLRDPSQEVTTVNITTHVMDKAVRTVEQDRLAPGAELSAERLNAIEMLRMQTADLDLNKPEDEIKFRQLFARAGYSPAEINNILDAAKEEFLDLKLIRDNAKIAVDNDDGGSIGKGLGDIARENRGSLGANMVSLEQGIPVKDNMVDGEIDVQSIERQAPEALDRKITQLENTSLDDIQASANQARQEQLAPLIEAGREAIRTGDRSQFDALAGIVQKSDNRVNTFLSDFRKGVGLKGASPVEASRMPKATEIVRQRQETQAKVDALVAEANALANKLLLAPKGGDSEAQLSDLVSHFLHTIRDQDHKTRQLIMAQLANQMMTQSITSFYKEKTDKNNQYHEKMLNDLATQFEQNVKQSIQSSLVSSASDAQAVASVSGRMDAGEGSKAMGIAQMRQNARLMLERAQQMNPPLINDRIKEKILNDSEALLTLTGSFL